MPENNFRVNGTGPVGIYLTTATTAANRMTGTSTTYYPLGTCETYPLLDEENSLTPVFNDMYGDSPYTYMHSGMMGTIQFVLNRFTWANLLKLINSDPQQSLETEAVTGTQQLNRAGILGARGTAAEGSNHAFGLYLHYGWSNDSNYSGRLPGAIVGRRYHSVSLAGLQIISAGTRQLAATITLKPSLALNSDGNVEMYRNLTSIPSSLNITDFVCQDIATTGAIGVYGSVDNGSNYVAIGHCERFPIITYTRNLQPISCDLFGDVPFDYQFMGEQTTIEMDFNRFNASNLNTVLNASFHASRGVLTQSKIGAKVDEQGSTLKLWFPSSERPSTANALVFNRGHFMRATPTSMGSRQYKEGVIWANAGVPDCSGTTGNLQRWDLVTDNSAALSDFTS